MFSERASLCGLMAVALTAEPAGAQVGYQRPPREVTAILDAPPPTTVSASPTGEFALLVQTGRYPSIAEVAEPTLGLAGLRINPRTNGPAREPRVTGLSVVRLAGGEPKPLALPAGRRVSFPIWSHDGKMFAVTCTTEDGTELWLGDVEKAELKPVPNVRVNAAIGHPVQWLPGEHKLLVQTVPAGREKPPVRPLAPAGPVVQESDGKAAPVRTFQDLLKNPHDEALFDYYTRSQLAVVGPGGTLYPVGLPASVVDAAYSPDGEFLLVTTLKRPYSYLHPYSAFPRIVEVWDRTGKTVLTVTDQPLQDKVPIEGVPTGRRAIRWVPTQPHTLTWVEALDKGDPRNQVPHRDAVYVQEVGVKADAAQVLQLEHRFAGLDFFPDGKRVLVRDYERERKWSRTFLTTFKADGKNELEVLHQRSIQDRYRDITPLTEVDARGQRVLRMNGDYLLMHRPGASPKGDSPSLWQEDTIRRNGRPRIGYRKFQCAPGIYEDIVAVLDRNGDKLLIRRESPTLPPNYFFRDKKNERLLTDNLDPAPELRKAEKTMVRAKREDGVELTITLHTPPGFKKGDKPLPAVLYAYPVEFASAADAGQVTGSPYRFTTVSGYSHLFFLTQGYAVLEVSMPVVGPPKSANDTFVEQLVMNAKAAIDAAAADGAIDRDRVGVMGHSYGAFMTANLLAHSDLFRAGIGRSGAYNRTLTPFGFQNERRTFWEAPEVYGKMSPFFHASKINEPLLLIHGAADSNPGTFPVQSERLYQAVRGNGGTVRLVMLPHEDHGYAARESVEHVLYEQIAWFDRYVKNAKPRK
jgi:dipeptidyl aminopeptidase/acylaminoacyl peptidase